MNKSINSISNSIIYGSVYNTLKNYVPSYYLNMKTIEPKFLLFNLYSFHSSKYGLIYLGKESKNMIFIGVYFDDNQKTFELSDIKKFKDVKFNYINESECTINIDFNTYYSKHISENLNYINSIFNNYQNITK